MLLRVQRVPVSGGRRWMKMLCPLEATSSSFLVFSRCEPSPLAVPRDGVMAGLWHRLEKPECGSCGASSFFRETRQRTWLLLILCAASLPASGYQLLQSPFGAISLCTSGRPDQFVCQPNQSLFTCRTGHSMGWKISWQRFLLWMGGQQVKKLPRIWASSLLPACIYTRRTSTTGGAVI